MPTIVFTLFFFVLMLVNLVIADRLAPRTRAMGPEDEMVERYRSYVAPYAGRVRFVISAFFAFIVGSGVSSQWSSWILFRNHVSFHQRDPQFHRDIGFYVFQLPFLRFVSQWLFVSFVLVLLDRRGLPLRQRRHPTPDAVPAGDAAGEGAPLGDPRVDGVHEDVAVLPRPLRARVLDPGSRRRRDLHRRARRSCRP